MIKYDWNILQVLDLKTVLAVLNLLETRDFSGKGVSKELLKIIASFKDVSGFLINPTPIILGGRKYTKDEIFIYLELAALRSYIDYKTLGKLYLPTYYIKHKYSTDKLRNNRLLIVTDDKISLKYEEINNGKSI